MLKILGKRAKNLAKFKISIIIKLIMKLCVSYARSNIRFLEEYVSLMSYVSYKFNCFEFLWLKIKKECF